MLSTPLPAAFHSGATDEPKEKAMVSRFTTLAVGASIALTPLSPLMAIPPGPLDAPAVEASVSDPVAQAWTPATETEINEARGGYFWVVGAGGTAIRLCLKNAKACQATGVFVAKSFASAKAWACKKYGRFC